MHRAIWHCCPNGFRLLTLEMPHLRSLRLDLFLRGGSRWETRETSGLSHLLEHMLFNGTASYPSALELALAAADIGGAMNGETGQEMTAYSLWTRPQHARKAVELLASMVCEPLLDAGELEVEKQIILAEIAEQPKTKTLDELVWPDHPLSLPVPGAPATVRSFRREHLMDWYRRFYTPDNMVLVVSGPIRAAEMQPLVEQTFSRLQGRFAETFVPAPPELRSVFKRGVTGRSHFTTLHDQGTYHAALAYRAWPATEQQRAAMWLLNTILGNSDTSRLFLQVREERGLVYSIDSHLSLWSDAGLIEIEFRAAKPKLRRSLREVVAVLERLCAEPVAPAELRRAQEWRVASLESVLDEPEALARRYACGALFGDEIPIERLIDLTLQVTPEDLLELCRDIFRAPDRPGYLLVQGPQLQRDARQELRAMLHERTR